MTKPTLSLVLLALPLALTACQSSVEVPIDVSGTVVDRWQAPAAGVRVQVGSTLTTTDASGHFSLSGVTSPYDVTLIPKDSSDPHVFLGLTSAAPTLRIYNTARPYTPGMQFADLTIDVSPAQGSSEKTGYAIEYPDDPTRWQATISNQTAPGVTPLSFVWSGGAAAVRVHAFRYEADPSTGAPQHYTGYDTALLPLLNHGHAIWKASWKTPTWSERTLSVSTKLPDGYEIWQSLVALRTKSDGSSWAFAWAHGNAATVSFVVPELDGASFDIEVCAADGASSSCRTVPALAAGAQGTVVEVEPGPTLISPAAGASFGVGSEIQWSMQEDEPVFLLLYPQDGAPGRPSYFIATADESVVIPDLHGIGIDLPSGLDYNLGVFHNAAFGSVDDLAAHDRGFRPQDEPSTYAYSRSRSVKSR